MRLFRRSLLCLVVGVTAFGVAAWVFRPRATWTIELPSIDWAGHFVSHADDGPIPDSPIWIYLGHEEDRKTGVWRSILESRSPETGALLAKLDVPAGDPSPVVVDDSLLLAHFESQVLGKGRTVFRFIDAKGVAQRKVTLPGKWRSTRDARRAERIEAEPVGILSWLVDPRKRRLEVGVADLATGKIEQTWSFPGYTPRQSWFADLSADHKLLAICEEGFHGRVPPFGVEIIDLQTGERLRAPPPTSANEFKGWGLGGPSFSEDGRHLEYLWGPNGGRGGWLEGRRFELATRRLKHEYSRGPRPFPYGDEDAWIPNTNDDRYVYSATNHLTDECWFRVKRGDDDLPWRKFPYPLCEPAMSKGVRVSFAIVPGRTQLVATTEETPLIHSLPEALAERASESWRDPSTKTRWHDWSRGSWLDVGPTSNFEAKEVRHDMLLTLTWPNNGTQVVESWPLPPRDPKLPALGIAAGCMAGVWWVCARRYRKRLRRESHSGTSSHGD
jgi:hypothetical protein